MKPLDDTAILQLIRLADTGETVTHEGWDYDCQWAYTNDSGTSDCYYIYRTDNYDLFAYSVDYGDDVAAYGPDGYLEVEIGEWLEESLE